MVGLAADDVEAFLQVIFLYLFQRCQFFNVSSQCVEEKCGILNATVTQRTKFMELIDLEPSVQVIPFTIEHLSDSE